MAEPKDLSKQQSSLSEIRTNQNECNQKSKEDMDVDGNAFFYEKKRQRHQVSKYGAIMSDDAQGDQKNSGQDSREA